MQPWRFKASIILFYAVISQILEPSAQCHYEKDLISQLKIVPSDKPTTTETLEDAVDTEKNKTENDKSNIITSSIIDKVINNIELRDEEILKTDDISKILDSRSRVCIRKDLDTEILNSSKVHDEENDTIKNTVNDSLNYESRYNPDNNLYEFNISAETQALNNNLIGADNDNYNFISTNEENQFPRSEIDLSNDNGSFENEYQNITNNETNFEPYVIETKHNPTTNSTTCFVKQNEKYLAPKNTHLGINHNIASETNYNDGSIEPNNTNNNLYDIFSKNEFDTSIFSLPDNYNKISTSTTKNSRINLHSLYAKRKKNIKYKSQNQLERHNISVQINKDTSGKVHKMFVSKLIFPQNYNTFVTLLTRSSNRDTKVLCNLNKIKQSLSDLPIITNKKYFNAVKKISPTKVKDFSLNFSKKYLPSIQNKPLLTTSDPFTTLIKCTDSYSNVCPAKAIFFSPYPCKLCINSENKSSAFRNFSSFVSWGGYQPDLKPIFTMCVKIADIRKPSTIIKPYNKKPKIIKPIISTAHALNEILKPSSNQNNSSKSSILLANIIKRTNKLVETLSFPLAEANLLPYETIKNAESKKLLKRYSNTNNILVKDCMPPVSHSNITEQCHKSVNFVSLNGKLEPLLHLNKYQPTPKLKPHKIIPAMRANFIHENKFTIPSYSNLKPILSKKLCPMLNTVTTSISPTLSYLRFGKTLVNDPDKPVFCARYCSSLALNNYLFYTVPTFKNCMRQNSIQLTLPKTKILCSTTSIFSLHKLFNTLAKIGTSKKTQLSRNSCRLHQKEPCGYIAPESNFSPAESSLNYMSPTILTQAFEKLHLLHLDRNVA